MRAFCAICTADIAGEPHREPLGKGGAMVAVCASCVDEPAVEKHGPTIAYEPQSHGGMGQLVHDAHQRIVGQIDRRVAAPVHDRRPGWLTVRIPNRNGRGEWRDRRAATKAAIRQHGNEVRYVTNTDRYFVFERPDPESVRRELESINPLEAIEQFRVDTKPQRKP